jgi:hypothetical protein
MNWRKNPQFVIDLKEEGDVCVVLSQEEKEHSLGLYVLEYTGKRSLS